MNNLLYFLSNELKSLNLFDEALYISNLTKKAQYLGNHIQAWQNVIDIAKEPLPSQIHTAAKYLVAGAQKMFQNSEPLKQLEKDDVALALEILEQSPQLRTKGQLDPQKIEKLAKQFNSLNKEAQMQLAKNLWQGFKGLGPKAVKLIPFIGFIFNFIMGLKNFIYALTAFATLANESDSIGLNWIEVLFPSKLTESANNFKNQPDKLSIVVRLTKYAQVFNEDGISLISNIVDTIKDVIFLFLDVGTFGWMTVADIGLSFVIMAIEAIVTNVALKQYQPIINDLVSLASSKLEELKKPNIQDNDKEELYQFFMN